MGLKKQMITVVIMATGLILLNLPDVNAAMIQSNGNTPTTKNVDEWITQVRQMQGAGGALGLTDKIDFDETNYDGTKLETCDLKSSNTNLDIHLQKNTEYGAMVLLSASSYGNPEPIPEGGTTTGNKTGIVININGERVAAGTTDTASNYMHNAAKRYWNDYGNNKYYVGSHADHVFLTIEPKVGDAIEDSVPDWHDSQNNTWFCVRRTATYRDTPASGVDIGVLRRAYSGSVFSYYGGGSWWNGRNLSNDEASWGVATSARAAVVVGSGI